MRRTAEQTRAHLLATAGELFYWKGVRATGVDTVARAAEVAPTTLYRLYPSKDDLVAAYVEANAENYHRWFDDAADVGEEDPRDRIRAVFDALREQTRPEHCRGCPFLMTLTEFPDPDHPAHRASVALKTWVRERFTALARAADRPEIADQLVLVFEGVYASVQALGYDGPARSARAVVDALLD